MTATPPPPTDDLDTLREHVRRIAVEAQVATARHPSCGALATLRYALRELPPELRPPDRHLPPHPEDDGDDRQVELARLRRELREARQAAGSPTLFDLGQASR
jgi:hypothetical protein